MEYDKEFQAKKWREKKDGSLNMLKIKTIKETFERIFLEAVFLFCCHSAAATQTPTTSPSPPCF